MMEDGIYLVERTDEVAIGAAKTLVCPAYNQAEAKLMFAPSRGEFSPSFSKLMGAVGGWGFVRDYSPFVDGTHLSYLTAYNTKGVGETFFSFPAWNLTNYYTDEGVHIWFEITMVEVFAYTRGASKIFMKVWDYPSVDDFEVYYGAETNDGFVFGWISESYPTNPRTGNPWTIYDVVLDMVPGIWLKSGNATALSYRKPGAACREYYVKITTVDPLGHYPDEILYRYPDFEWGDSAVGINDPYIASCLYGGPEEWEEFYDYMMSITQSIESPQNIYDTKIRDAPPGTDTINSLTLSITLDDLSDSNEFKLWVKVGDTYYYGTALYPSSYASTTHTYTWSVNPATSAAWTRAELLAARIGCYNTNAASEIQVGIWDFHASISYGAPPATFLPACIAAGGDVYDSYRASDNPLMCLAARPVLEAIACTAGPHEFGATRETTLNDLNTLFYTYPATELPPTGSTIRYVKIDYIIGAGGEAGYPIAYKPYVEFPQKEYYYGTSGSISVNGIRPEVTYTWSTNPKTGAGWTYADLVDLRFGVWLQHSDCDPDDPFGDAWYRNSQIYEIKFEIGYGTSDTITTDASDNVLWGNPIMLTCDLSELPPRGSTIDGIEIDYGFGGTAEEAVAGKCSMAAWIYVDGNYYFSDEIQVGDPFYTESGIKTWATNPATGMAWTYADLTHLKWGAVFRNANESGTYYSAFARINELSMVIDYNEATPLPPTYRKLAVGEVLYWNQEWNPITDPDTLKFVTNIELPERQELAMFHDGLQIFHGIALSREKSGLDRYIILAKSQSLMLQYR
jgi:hypothetical protein